MVLAAHLTPVKCWVTTTLETVRFHRPGRIDFRLVCGPVPHILESFLLEANDIGTELRWQGELGTDLWAIGEWWGDAWRAHGRARSRAPSRRSPPRLSAARAPRPASSAESRRIDGIEP
jgi:hypothetical protein